LAITVWSAATTVRPWLFWTTSFTVYWPGPSAPVTTLEIVCPGGTPPWPGIMVLVRTSDPPASYTYTLMVLRSDLPVFFTFTAKPLLAGPMLASIDGALPCTAAGPLAHT
jgi:hypothetical protein